MKKLTNLLVLVGLMVGFAVAINSPAGAVNVFEVCSANPESEVCKSTDDDAQSIVSIVIETLIYVLGIISVIMIIIGGLRYTLSGGDKAGVTGAKNTIMYALIGLVVAISAFAIVKSLLGRI